MAVDELSNVLSEAAETTEVDATIVRASLDACPTTTLWQIYARADKIGEELGGLGDTEGPYTPAQALEFLCSRYDASSTTRLCRSL